MSSSAVQFGPAFYSDFRDFFFGPEILKLKRQDNGPKDWLNARMMSSKEFDTQCKARWETALDQAADMSVESLKASVNGNADDALALIVLLDQLPRNIYRGNDARRAHQVFDPKAVKLSRDFVTPPLNYDKAFDDRHFFMRLFFYMPLMHSEHLPDHHLSESICENLLSEATAEQDKFCINQNLEFSRKHTAVLERFGRYPSRNEALGRESTAAELAHLKDGPGW